MEQVENNQVTILCIGDPHFQVATLHKADLYIQRIKEVAIKYKPDLIVILGDVLHTHNIVQSPAMNKAYEFIHEMQAISETIVLVGNHDARNNGIFLTDDHWMNGMKCWENITIVDNVYNKTLKEQEFFFVPYVPNGRFVEALDTSPLPWRESDGIFAHQEFSGCKMGAITSIDGDKWPEEYPYIISGHIHSRQKPQSNIYYPGSSMQHAFGESEKNIIAFLTFEKGKKYIRKEIDLNLPRKKIVYLNIDNVDSYKPEDTSITGDEIKLTLSGNYEKFKVFKKSKKYKELVKKGIKVIFKSTRTEISQSVKDVEKMSKGTRDFSSILLSLVQEEDNKFLSEAYDLIVNNRINELEDNLVFL